MQNKVKSEQHFAVTSAKRVAAFQAISTLVVEETGAQLSNIDNKYLTSHGSNYLIKWGAVNRNNALI